MSAQPNTDELDDAGRRGTYLTADELVELTGRSRPSAQVRALRGMGFEHKVRPDGTVAVLRSHHDAVMGGCTPAAKGQAFKFAWE